MGGVGDELAASLLLLRQAARHLVEGVGQGLDLFGLATDHPRLVVTVGDPPRHARHLLQRPGEAGRQDHGQDTAHRDRDRGGDDEDPQHTVVEHRVGFRRRGSGLDHETVEDRLGHDQHPEADHAHGADRHQDREQGDPQRQAADHEPAAIHAWTAR